MRTLQRLEQALRLWEDECLIGRYIMDGNRQLGREPSLALVQHQEAIRRALTVRRALREDETGDRIWHQYRMPVELVGSLVMYPVALSAWIGASRRAFELHEDLERLLLATSLEGITWGQVPFPFGSFVLLLPTPIEDSEGTQFDCILYSSFADESGDGRVVRVFYLLSRQLDRLPTIDRRKIARDADRARWDRIQRESRQLGVALRTFIPVSACVVGASGIDQEVTHSMVEQMLDGARGHLIDVDTRQVLADPRVSGRYGHLWDAAAKLVVGLSFFLGTVEGQERGTQSDWVPSPRTTDPNAITQDAQICCVRTTNTLSREDREELDGIAREGYQMSAHFRRGHWRRHPGAGADPQAPKTIWVRPCLVRGDRLPDGGIPGGGLTQTS